MFKKLAISFLSLALLINVTLTKETTAEENDPFSWMKDAEAKISPYLYNYLLENAGMTSYLYADKTINLKETEQFFESILEKTNDYIIGTKFNYTTIITKEGLFISFADGVKYASTLYEGSYRGDIIVQRAVKQFAGPTVQSFAHLNFKHLDATSYSFIRTFGTVNLPMNVEIREITEYEQRREGNLNPFIFSPGLTHKIDGWTGQIDVDGIPIKNSGYDYGYVGITYKGDKITVSEAHTNNKFFNLNNHFSPIFKDADELYWATKEIQWAVKNGLVKGYADGTFKPENTLTEAQLATILARYFDLKSDQQYGHWSQPIYDMLKAYNLPLKGYKDDKVKDQPVTRGTLAQVFAATQGKKSELKSAVQFMYDNELATARNGQKTYESYGVDEVLKRSHISAFFQRLDARGFNEIK
ncbi:S-layer homology domain-containing protein [Bacillus salitolerans]|uniref:S-layer homology domain-containing protein n=1 Tax=Bacillus salitolerans TaxID=1437434 RepID=A0ABW4LRX5_9BACI